MRLVSFEKAGQVRVGALTDGDCLVDLTHMAARSAAAVWFADMVALIGAGSRALDLARRWIEAPADEALLARASVRLRAPLPVPAQLRDFANYELHVRQAIASAMRLRAGGTADPDATFAKFEAQGLLEIPAVWYEQPLYYKGNRFAFIGPDEDVHWPSYAEKLDYELELAAVIGGPAKDLRASNALEAVFGYTIFNDFSARDAQVRETQFRMGPAKGKDFDRSNAIGPCIVTRDEIPDWAALTMIARVNGIERVRTTSAGAHHSLERCLEHVSRFGNAASRRIFGLGTVGNGCGYESLTFLAPGDVVELEIEKIGVLRNRLVRPVDSVQA